MTPSSASSRVSKPAQLSKHTQPLDGFLFNPSTYVLYIQLQVSSLLADCLISSFTERTAHWALTCPRNHLFPLPPSLPSFLSFSFSLFFFLPQGSDILRTRMQMDPRIRVHFLKCVTMQAPLTTRCWLIVGLQGILVEQR